MASSNNKTNTLNELFKKVQQSKFIEESSLVTRILFSFIFIAIFSKLFFSQISSDDGSSGPATINIMSYLIILISLVCIVFTSTILQLYNNESDSNLTKTISWDLVAIVIYLLWIISINSKYFKKINSSKVPKNFFLYSNLSHFVLAFQL